MSNSLAIAAVTATLRNLLTQGLTADLPGTTVTTKPLDLARNGDGNGNQINLFLYQTALNAAWRNTDVPRQVKPGETGHPPLGLNLYYLITAYGQNEDETLSHRLLGRAMSILHDHPLLGAVEIKAALPENDLHEQVERVRITPEPLSLDEMSKLWTAFQTQYRVSTAYHVSVVLIESTRSTKTPLPVLTRGPADQGVASQPDLIPPFPTLVTLLPPNKQPSALLGDLLIVGGHHLDGSSVSVEVRHPRLQDARSLQPEPGGTAVELKVRIPNQPNNFPAGFYTLAAVITRAGETFNRITNELAFALAPQIAQNPPISAVRNADEITITLTCLPTVLPDQRVALLVGEQEVLAGPHPTATNNLTFVPKDLPTGKFPAGTYFVRLRVDGVDSLLVDRTVMPPVFDPTQRVTIP